MNAATPPIALHGKDIERATNLDRSWFAQNPGCSYYLRHAMPNEFNGPLDEPPDGLSWRVLVVGFAGAPVRLRLPLALPALVPNEGFSEDMLARLFKRAVPSRFRKLPARLKKEAAQFRSAIS